MSVVFPIEQNDRVEIYTLTAGQTSFSVPFPFQDAQDISVIRVSPSGVKTVLVRPADFTLTGAGNPSGGTGTLVAPGVAGEKLEVIGAAVLERTSSIVRNGSFNSRAIDDEFDRNRIIQQEHDRDIDRSIKTAFGQSGLTLDTTALAVGDTLMIGAGNTIVKGPDAAEIQAAQGYAGAAGASASLATDEADRSEAEAEDSAASAAAALAALAAANLPSGLAGQARKTLRVNSLGTAYELGNFKQPEASAVEMPYIVKMQQMVSLLDFYPGGDDRTADAAPALNYALANYRRVYIPSGRSLTFADKWRFNATIMAVQMGQCIIGDGHHASMCETSGQVHKLTVNNGLNGVQIEGLDWRRPAGFVPNAFASGIVFLGTTVNVSIKNNTLQDDWRHMSLLSTANSEIESNKLSRAFGDASIYATHSSSGVFWHMYKNRIERSNGHGIFYQFGGPAIAAVPVGEMVGNDFFSVSGSGIRLFSPTIAPITNINIRGGFIGSCGNHGIDIDASGQGYHKIVSVSVEQVGVDPTGVDYATAASAVGSGMNLVNCRNITVNDCHIETIAWDGITSNASDVQATGNTVLNCGNALLNARRNSYYAITGRLNITGGRAGASSAAVNAQEYAIQASDGGQISACNLDARFNQGAAGPNRFFANAGNAKLTQVFTT